MPPMKIATIIARVLLGLAFVVFGLNFFFNFIPAPPPPPGLAGDYLKVFAASGYTHVVGADATTEWVAIVNRSVCAACSNDSRRDPLQHLDFSPSDGASRPGPCRGRDAALGFSCLELPRTLRRSIAAVTRANSQDRTRRFRSQPGGSTKNSYRRKLASAPRMGRQRDPLPLEFLRAD